MSSSKKRKIDTKETPASSSSSSSSSVAKTSKPKTRVAKEVAAKAISRGRWIRLERTWCYGDKWSSDVYFMDVDLHADFIARLTAHLDKDKAWDKAVDGVFPSDKGDQSDKDGDSGDEKSDKKDAHAVDTCSCKECVDKRAWRVKEFFAKDIGLPFGMWSYQIEEDQAMEDYEKYIINWNSRKVLTEEEVNNSIENETPLAMPHDNVHRIKARVPSSPIEINSVLLLSTAFLR